MPRATYQSSGWEDALAAILGGLGGGIEGWQTGKRIEREDADRKAQGDRQARLDAREDAEHALRMEEQEERRRQRGERDALTMLTDLGQHAIVTPEQATQVRRGGLDHRLEDSVDFSRGLPVVGGPAPFFLPSRVQRVAPTSAERQATADTRAAEARLARTRAALEAAGDDYELRVFDANPSGYKPTRESFVPFPVKKREAQDAARGKIDAEVEKAKALQPLELEEHEGKAKIDAKYRPPPAARDRGPTDYQTFGMIDKLNARFNANTKATREVARQYQVMQTSWQALEKGTSKGTAEQGIVSTFNKILDPDSVVREGEYDRTAQGQALLQRMQTIKDNAATGGKISRAVLKDMVDLAGTYAQKAEAFNAAEKARVGGIADRMGIDQALIFTAEPDAGEPPPASRAPPTLGEVRIVNGQRGRWDGTGWAPVR